jgi:hypothetical protein
VGALFNSVAEEQLQLVAVTAMLPAAFATCPENLAAAQDMETYAGGKKLCLCLIKCHAI